MISVVLLTYNRLDYAKRTLKSLAVNLRTREEIKWCIASDGDSEAYLADLSAVANDKITGTVATITNSQRGGYGKNYNLAMQNAHEAEYIIPVEDDWDLLKPLDVDAVIRDMQLLDIGCARLGYIGYTQELRGRFAPGVACGQWLILDADSPEPHVFAGHPRVETRDWARSVGPWPEGLLPGETEFTVAKLPAARQRVAWPLDLVKPAGDLFAHIGSVRSY